MKRLDAGKGATGVLPEPPAYLDDQAKVEYRTLAEVLDAEGTLAQTDTKLLELYAVNYSILVRAYGELQRQGLTIESTGGRLFVNPNIGTITNATQKVRQVITDLGLSPTAAKLVEHRLPASTAGDKWEGLL